MGTIGNAPRIALVGAGGMAFGPTMVLDAVRAKKIRGATLTLIDLAEDKLEVAYAAAERLNDASGNPIEVTKTTSLSEGLEGADYVLISAEMGRWKFWAMDYRIPRKYGATQIMGENGGPGGVFHAMRSAKNVLGICREVERIAPDAWVLNLTNPMNPVTLTINRGTKLKNVGLCHELFGGRLRIAFMLMLPVERIFAEAFGINHFTWFYKIEDAETGEDLYPKIRRHFKLFGLLHEPLVRYTFKKYGLMATSSDSHISEYLPYSHKVNKVNFPYHQFFERESEVRSLLVKAYGRGMFPLAIDKLPSSGELPFPIIEGLFSGDRTYLSNVVVPNKGYTPNLPDGKIVEVAAYASDAGIEPITTPPIPQDLADLILKQYDVQELIVEAVLNGDRDKALEAILIDPQSPPESKARRMFDEMCKLQQGYLPF